MLSILRFDNRLGSVLEFGRDRLLLNLRIHTCVAVKHFETSSTIRSLYLSLLHPTSIRLKGSIISLSHGSPTISLQQY